MKDINKENFKPKEKGVESNSSKREKFEAPNIVFVPVKIEERLMQGTCSNTADNPSCIAPFKLS